MKSLRNLRMENHMSLQDVQDRSGLTKDWLSEIERGITVPLPYTRKKLELIFDQKINWLDIPVLRTTPTFPTTWLECEREFKGLYRYVKGLPDDERNDFIITIINHLTKIKEE
jgi:transcriptional regulator with XRE-family HTH domain